MQAGVARFLRLSANAAALLALFACTVLSGAQTYAVIHQFNQTDGAWPIGNLIADSAGNLYGVTEYGGTKGFCAEGCGTVFQLKKYSGTWQFNEIYQFTGGSDGFGPLAGLTMDSAGNLYGTAYQGGANSQGVVYELSPGAGGSWTQSVLWAFQGTASNDGAFPASQMVFDSSGNLYGTTELDGTGTCGAFNTCGTVFMLSPNSSGGWTESILYNFNIPTIPMAPTAGSPPGRWFSTATAICSGLPGLVEASIASAEFLSTAAASSSNYRPAWVVGRKVSPTPSMGIPAGVIPQVASPSTQPAICTAQLPPAVTGVPATTTPAPALSSSFGQAPPADTSGTLFLLLREVTPNPNLGAVCHLAV
jgi:uncharacterized repeat protein (TIGR03803 family)